MTEKNNSTLLPKIACFATGFVGMFVLALLAFYPVLLALFFGGGTAESVAGSTWSTPLLLLSLLMSAWFMTGFLSLLLPALIARRLPAVLQNNLWGDERSRKDKHKEPVGAHQNFVNGRTFVLSSSAGKILVWPAIVFSIFLILPMLFGDFFMYQILGGMFGSLFFAALLVRLFMPNLLSILGREQTSSHQGAGWTPISATPFIRGILISTLLAAILNLTGLLPLASYPLQATDRANNNTQTGPAIGEDTTQTAQIFQDDGRHYVTWKDDEFVEVETAFCANGMSIFLPKDKSYIGTSTDPDSVVYDPYASGTDTNGQSAIGIEGPPRQRNGARGNVTNDQNALKSTRAATARDDASAPGRVLGTNTDLVRDLGAPWGLGSVVYRGEEKLSGYDFLESSHIFTTKAFITSPDGTEIETEALLVPTGCAEHFIAGISMRRQLLSDLHGFAHLVAPSNVTDGDIGVDTVNTSLITDIPILDLEYSEKLLRELDKLIAQQGRKKGVKQPPIIMVARWTREQESEIRKIEEAKIRKALAARQRSNVTWVLAGQLSPFCNIASPDCTALNNSTTVSVSRYRQE